MNTHVFFYDDFKIFPQGTVVVYKYEKVIDRLVGVDVDMFMFLGVGGYKTNIYQAVYIYEK